MFHFKQHAPIIRVHHFDEAVLMRAVFARNQPTFIEPIINPAEIHKSQLDMVAIECRLRLVGFTEGQELLARHAHIKQAIAHRCAGADDLLIEARNARQRAMRDIEFDIGHAERDAAELFGIRAMAAHAIAPGAGHIHMVFRFNEGILRAFQPAPRAIQPMQKLRAIRQHQARCATQHLCRAGRQMELADAGIGPHIVDAGHQIRIAGQAKCADVKGRGLQLIGNLQIDMLQFHDIAHGFFCSIPRACEFCGAVHCFAPFVCCNWFRCLLIVSQPILPPWAHSQGRLGISLTLRRAGIRLPFRGCGQNPRSHANCPSGAA